jgi:GDP-4-dehydro-6-deoxy-D-mannose reductase
MKITVARPFNIVGGGIPRHLVVGAILCRAREALRSSEQPVVRVGNLESERDFVAVRDVVDAYLRMVRGGYWGQVFNLCSGQPRSVRSMVELLLAHSKKHFRLETDVSLVRSSEPKILYGDSTKAYRAFGFKPSVPIEEALREAWETGVNG